MTLTLNELKAITFPHNFGGLEKLMEAKRKELIKQRRTGVEQPKQKEMIKSSVAARKDANQHKKSSNDKTFVRPDTHTKAIDSSKNTKSRSNSKTKSKTESKKNDEKPPSLAGTKRNLTKRKAEEKEGNGAVDSEEEKPRKRRVIKTSELTQDK